MSRVAPLALLLLSLAPSLASAAERHVPAAYASVAAALDAAQAGDEIVIAAGVFPLATTRTGMNVTLRGAGRDLTFLDGGGADVLVFTDSTVTVRSLTVRNGHDGMIVTDGSAVLEQVRFRDCITDGFELSDHSAATARDVEFVFNGDDGIDMGDDAALLCIDCVVSDNDGDGIEIRLHDFIGPPLTIEIAGGRIERNHRTGIQLIDYDEPNDRSFYFHDVLIASNEDGGVTWQCCGDSGEDLDGWPGDEPVRIERATIVGNGGPGVEGGGVGLMEVRDSILTGNAYDLYQVGGPLGANLVGVDPLFTTDYRLALASPARGAGSGGADLGAFPWRECSDGSDNDADGEVDLLDDSCTDLDDATELTPIPNVLGCGLGPELAVGLAGLALLRRRRLTGRRRR